MGTQICHHWWQKPLPEEMAGLLPTPETPQLKPGATEYKVSSVARCATEETEAKSKIGVDLARSLLIRVMGHGADYRTVLRRETIANLRGR